MIETVFDMYKGINLGSNEICKKCKQSPVNGDLSAPVSMWNCGDHFDADEFRVMFVGKAARGEPGERTHHGFLDGRACGKDLYDKESWPYWSYTKEIAKRLWDSPEEGWYRFAFTNIVKCNNSRTIDAATLDMKTNCIAELRVIWREIEVLRPKNVIFYTHRNYDGFIGKFSVGDTYVDVKDQSHTIPNGKKKMSWWHREFYSNGQLVMRMLRTSHPERQGKEVYVSNLVEWIKAGAFDRQAVTSPVYTSMP